MCRPSCFRGFNSFSRKWGFSFAIVYKFTTWGLRISKYFASIWARKLFKNKEELYIKWELFGQHGWCNPLWGYWHVKKWRNLSEVPLLFLGKVQAKFCLWVPNPFHQGTQVFMCVPEDKIFFFWCSEKPVIVRGVLRVFTFSHRKNRMGWIRAGGEKAPGQLPWCLMVS